MPMCINKSIYFKLNWCKSLYNVILYTELRDTNFKVDLDNGVNSHIRKIWIWLTFASILVIMTPSVAGNIPHLLWADAFSSASRWPLPRNGKKRERDRERQRERGNKADVTVFLAGGKKQKITRSGILRWGQNPRIPPDPQMVSIMAHRSRWEQQSNFHQELLTKTDWSSFSCRGEPADYWKRHTKKLVLDKNKMSHVWGIKVKWTQ